MLGLDPDIMSARATNRLIEPHRWELLGQSETHIWGEFKRANSSSHQIGIQLKDLSTNCPCVSVKHPCKFVISLLSLFAMQPDLFEIGPSPVWIEKRRNLAIEKQKQVVRETSLHDVKQGMGEFALWLRDQVRQGLAGFEGQKSAGLESMANRLIDAHVPTLGEKLRQLAQEVAPRKGEPPENWPEILLKGYGKYYVLTQAWGRFDQLNGDEQADLIQACVSPAVRALWLDTPVRDTIRDDWRVVGRRFETTGRIWNRRTWLVGENSGRLGLMYEQTSGRNMIVTNLATGSIISGEFTFELGTLGAVGKLTQVEKVSTHPAKNDGQGASNFAMLEKEYVTMLTQNPWLPAWPVLLKQVRLQFDLNRDRWLLIDEGQRALPITHKKEGGWYLLASGRGRPLDVMAEWTTEGLQLLSTCSQGNWVDSHVWGGRL